jgi:hypothetical protein
MTIRVNKRFPVRFVPLPGGKLAAPEEFTVTIEDETPYKVEMACRVVDGAAVCVSLCCHGDESVPVNSSGVRSLAVARWMRLGLAMASLERGTDGSCDNGAGVSLATSHSRGRRPIDDSGRLHRVAEVYNAASRAPTQAVAGELHYSLAQAGRLVRAARDAGLIEGSGRRRRLITHEHLVEVAAVYNAAVKYPTKAVADHFHTSRQNARKWLHEARNRHLLDERTGYPLVLASAAS